MKKENQTPEETLSGTTVLPMTEEEFITEMNVLIPLGKVRSQWKLVKGNPAIVFEDESDPDPTLTTAEATSFSLLIRSIVAMFEKNGIKLDHSDDSTVMDFINVSPRLFVDIISNERKHIEKELEEKGFKINEHGMIPMAAILPTHEVLRDRIRSMFEDEDEDEDKQE